MPEWSDQAGLKGNWGYGQKVAFQRDICSKYIAPAIQQAGWDMHKQVREEVSFTKGRIIVRGKLHSRGEARRADFILYHQTNLPIAVIEAKDNKHSERYKPWLPLLCLRRQQIHPERGRAID